MNTFEQYLHNCRELKRINEKFYVELNVFLKYLGQPDNYEQRLNLRVVCLGTKIYISSKDAENLMKTSYNKNNSKVVQYHKDMGITGMEYTMSARAFNPVVSSFGKITNRLKTFGDSIDAALSGKS